MIQPSTPRTRRAQMRPETAFAHALVRGRWASRAFRSLPFMPNELYVRARTLDEANGQFPIAGPGGRMDWRLELVVVPVWDVDLAKAFYLEKAGFALDVDHRARDFRVVQLTPKGSACSTALMAVGAAPRPLH